MALFSVLQLVGASPKEGAIVWIATHTVGMTALLLTRAPAAGRLRRVAVVGMAVAASLLIAAPHWLVFLDTLTRSASMYDDPKVYLLPWQQTPAAVTLGALTPGRPFPSVNGLVAVLALTALVAPQRLWSNRAVLACAAGAAFALGLASGLVPASVILEVPFLRNVYEVWNPFITSAVVPLLIVAGAGVATLRAMPFAGVIGACAATLLLWFAVGAGFPPLTTSLGALKLAALGPAIAFAVLYACAGLPTSSASPVLLAAAAFAAAVFPQGVHVETKSERLNALLFQPRPRVALGLPAPAIVAARERAGGQPFRATGIELVLLPGTQAYYRIEGLGGPDVLALREEIELFDAAHIERDVWRPVVRTANLHNARGLLDMLGVRFVLGRALHLPSEMPRLPLTDRDPVSIVERPAAWPRAFFVDGVRRHRSVQEFAAALEASSQPFASIDGADQRALALAGGLPALETRRIRAGGYVLTPNSTTFDVEAPGPGVAILGEAFEPLDFVATLNGETVDYFQVNHVFKGVAIPVAGSWRIVFTYRPRLLFSSIAIALAGAAALARLVVRSRRSD